MAACKNVGLFLGAGASYELGMPLVSHLTGEFKGYFTPTHLKDLNASWRAQGGGYPDAVIEAVVGLLVRDDLNYENILGFLQTHSGPSHADASHYGSLYVKMVEIVALMLIYRQTRSLTYISRGFPPFEGLAELAGSSSPLWVFSLNHDLILELLAQHCGIPLRDGFWPNNVITIPHIDVEGRMYPPLSAEVISEDDLSTSNLHLFRDGEVGINLLKLHGAIDVFSVRDGRDLCRLRPIDQELDGRLRALAVANDELGYWHNRQKAHATNEITYADESGTMQFLQRTLLAGSQKFNQAYHQTLPHKMLDIFRSYINYVQDLYVVGYSFGDVHVDLVLRNWLETSEQRRMIVVNPCFQGLPPYFAHLAPQLDIKPLKASEFFAQFRQEPMTKAQQAELYLREKIRPCMERRAAKKW